MAQHVKHRLEPQVLYVALPVAIQGQTKVLWAQVRMVSVGILDRQVPLWVNGRTKSHRGHMACVRAGSPHESHLQGDLLLWWGWGMGLQQSQAGTEGNRHLSLCWEHSHHTPHTSHLISKNSKR